DTAGITVTPTTGLVLSEAGQTDTVDIVLNSQPTADVTINVSASPVGQATVSVSSVTFTPANWNVAQTVTLAAIDDDIDEGATGVALITDPATSADATYNGLNAIDVNGSILDNDTRGVVVSAISGPTTENGGTATFTVVLTSQPTGNVSIPLATSDASEGTVSAASVDFTPANWNTPQTITVTGADDSIVDGDVAYSIVTGAIGGSSDYAGIDPNDVSVTNEDDDVLTLTLNINPASVSEADGTGAATGTVTRNDGDLGSELIVTLTSSDASAATVATTVTIAAGETSATFSIDAVDDALIDGTQTTTITAAATNYVSASGDLDVTDDDGIVNTAPEILTLAAAGFDNKALPGEPVELTGSFSDLDVGDTHTVIVAWGDGTTETLTAAQVNQADDTFAASHVYATGGLFTIEVTVVDSQAASDTEQTAAAVTGLRVTDGGVLQIVGTNERDDVDVSLVLVRVPQTSNSRGNGNGRDDDDDDRGRGRGRGRGDNFTYELKLQVVAVLGRGRDRVEIVEYFDPEAITAIEIYLCDGNDRATVLVDDCDDSVAAIPTTVDAGDGNDLVWTGAGNDLLIGGGGNDWLLSGDGDDVVLGGAGNDGIDGGDGDDALSGGEGNDDIYGGRGNDLLIGGLGRDWLSGERDDDLLVAMRWTGEEDEAALLAVLAEWTRTDASYADKLDHLTGVAPGLNGSQVLDDSTLEDDGSRDNLEGDSGRDLFFAQMDGRRRDRLRDDRWYEAVFDIDG
ncbi:MAG: hypothetical protein KDA55_13645, partial [Planctomycetales bacterium]|nr:hypothetical protein [Planctomycetales bacterium]